MKKLLILLLFLVTVSLQSFADCENPSAPGKIRSVQVNIPGKVFVYLSDEPGIRVIGDSISKRYITYYVKNGVLVIKTIPGMEEYLAEKSPIIYVSINVESVEIISNRKFTISRKTKSGNHIKK